MQLFLDISYPSTAHTHSHSKTSKNTPLKSSCSSPAHFREFDEPYNFNQCKTRTRNNRANKLTGSRRNRAHSDPYKDQLNRLDILRRQSHKRRHNNSNSNTNTNKCRKQRMEGKKSQNYYSKIRFHRQRGLSDPLNNKNQRDFPSKIQDITSFHAKYRYLTNANSEKKLLGYGAMSKVYKVYLLIDKRCKYAMKISKYSDYDQYSNIIKENRLLHRFGNGLLVKDIYDDKIKQQLLFIIPHGRDLKQWWKSNTVQTKFESENTTNKEMILKKILFKILINLKFIHDNGYIHHDIKPQNILVTKKNKRKLTMCENDVNNKIYNNKNSNGGGSTDWIEMYDFHIIDYGLSVECAFGNNVLLDADDIRFGTFGYNAWELMKTNVYRKYNHSIDLYALGLTLCELVFNENILRMYQSFKVKQEIWCYNQLIENNLYSNAGVAGGSCSSNNGGNTDLSEYDLYSQTLRLKCSFWRTHFGRNDGVNALNGDESYIRSIIIKELQTKTKFTTRFKNFISNILRDNPSLRIQNVEQALNHDLFYNVY